MNCCRFHTPTSPCEEAVSQMGNYWYCHQCAADKAMDEGFYGPSMRDTTEEDERAAFNDRLDMYRREF